MSAEGKSIYRRAFEDPAHPPADPWADVCVGCGADVRGPDSRPFVLPYVARAGHEVELCDACAYLFHHGQVQKRLARILTVMHERTLDNIQPTRGRKPCPHAPEIL